MGNLFRTDLTIHRRYDLKGSSLGRFTVNPQHSSTLKDLDLCETFKLEPRVREQLSAQLDADAKFLEQNNIMDYSLLLGVHYLRPNHPVVAQQYAGGGGGGGGHGGGGGGGHGGLGP